MTQQFNLDEALELVKQGARIDGKDGVFAPPIKQLTEVALQAEIESHQSSEICNRKNGNSKTLLRENSTTLNLNGAKNIPSLFSLGETSGNTHLTTSSILKILEE